MATMKSDLELFSVDDNSTFLESSLIEDSGNFDEWLDKNGVQYIIKNECLNPNMISNELDPLMNQINTNDTLDGFSDSESNLMKGFEASTRQLHFKTLTCKSKYLESTLPGGMNVEFQLDDSKILILITNNTNDVIPFPEMYISLSDLGGQITIPKQKVPVISLERVVLAENLDAYMPCLNLETNLRLYICPKPDCPLVYTRFGAAKLHTFMQIGHKPFKCDYPNCTWAFYNSFKLRRHQESHTNSKDFVCIVDNCGRKFTNIYNLNIHIKNHHEKPANLPCHVAGCNQKFQTARLRDKHFKTHDSKEAPFQCPHKNCNRSFFLMTGLTSHARIHTHRESELKCDYPNCGKVFEQPCRLKEHSRQHTGFRPYICTYDQCTWSFTTASKLKRHQSTHTKERKFHCTIGTCNKSFLRSEHLKEHTLTHIGPRSFNCEVCSASFFGKSSLYLHVKKHHPEQNQASAKAKSVEQEPETPTPEMLLEQAIQSLGVPSDMMLGTGLLPEEPLVLLENDNFSTVNLRDLE
ncbi:PREDICTED: zinc finger protein ZXDC-like [Nicrophorus vespilloides]|uniref:Zinc finger protein ZXDC-like n=1 Tax=Nicrophorus vespilloides TaxID=110193 RepID=A0ABM1N638_NICVS|nr:PREDICTED: zinc finger protein ZXDC-like [Nicrophorus vespilloides]